MFKWLNERLAGTSHFKAAEALRIELEPLQKVKGVQPRLVDRLIRFVFTGEDEDVVAELAALQNTRYTITVPFNYSLSSPTSRKGLPALIKQLPEDPKIYFRLATVYDAAYQAGSTVSYGSLPVAMLHGSLSWLNVFLGELSNQGKQRDAIFPVNMILEMLRVAGEDPNVLVKAAFFYEDAQGKSTISRYNHSPIYYFKCLSNFADLVVKSAELVKPAFSQKEASSRAAVLQALVILNVPPDPFVEEIASLAVSGSKEVREHAGPIISDRFEIFRVPLETLAESGSADERYHAVRLLTRFGGDGERAFLTQRLEREKSARVCELINAALIEPASPHAVDVVDDYGLPAIPEIAVHAPLDKQLLVDLRTHLEEAERRTADEFSRNVQAKMASWTRTPVKPEAADRIFEALQDLVISDDMKFPFFAGSFGVDQRLLNSFPIPKQFQPIHLIRWCLLLNIGHSGKLADLDPWLLYRWRPALVSYQKVHKKTLDLRELAAVFKAIGLDDRALGRQILQATGYLTTPLIQLEPNKVWPYFAERLDLVEEGLGLKQSDDQNPYRTYLDAEKRRNAFAILSSFPHPPAKLVPMLWDIALSASKTERTVAQQCLNGLPGKEKTILAALTSRQQDARFAAAYWLGTLGDAAAIPALRQALAKEKNEFVRDELIKSLETLGVPLEELLDLNQLDSEAEKGLKKGIPKELDWFPFSQLPAVTWADSGQPVPATIIQWFILQSYKLKSGEAGPTLRRYCSIIRKDDRERLGKFVLEAWIAQDTKPKYTADQAAAEAQKAAQQIAQAAKQYPQYYGDFDAQSTYQSYFNSYLNQPEGSQTSTKGILAVAGACCGSDAAPIVHRYVKQWYGYRAAQCKALLQVLASIDHPSATQVVLSIANRFRTKGIQEEALRLCQVLAERRGWTMEELGDRTIPTVGFDEIGKMELDYGARQFTAILSDEMAITITNQNGKVIASLPDANQSDDAEKVKQAKSQLSGARKELKSILAMQKDRLYEALCTQRTWRFEDWDTYLRQHPIAGRYCQRLVWVAYDGEKILKSFRPLADGTLTDNQDDEVKFTSETDLRLGHDETLPQEDRTAWLQHFSDYEVEPLFQQFGKQQFSLPEDMKEETEINDFLGHIIMAFSLRNRLTRLGYTRGQAQDAGWFHEYRKTFLQLGIESVIEFTGNGLPEQNLKVALQRLYFVRKLDGPASISEEIALGELPRVLLSECWNDIRLAAAEGPGFAADWKKQTEFR